MEDIPTMGAFAENEMLDYPLLADIDGSVAGRTASDDGSSPW